MVGLFEEHHQFFSSFLDVCWVPIHSFRSFSLIWAKSILLFRYLHYPASERPSLLGRPQLPICFSSISLIRNQFPTRPLLSYRFLFSGGEFHGMATLRHEPTSITIVYFLRVGVFVGFLTLWAAQLPLTRELVLFLMREPIDIYVIEDAG